MKLFTRKRKKNIVFHTKQIPTTQKPQISIIEQKRYSTRSAFSKFVDLSKDNFSTLHMASVIRSN